MDCTVKATAQIHSHPSNFSRDEGFTLHSALAAQEIRSVKKKIRALQLCDSRHWPHQNVPSYVLWL